LRGIATTTACVGGRRVALIDGFSLRRRDAAVDLPLGAQRLVAFLALKPKALLRIHVASVLWADTTEDKAVAILRTTLWRLRRADLDVVESSGPKLALAPGVRVDVLDVAIAARRMLARPREAVDENVELAGLAGEVLPDWYDDWLLIERERFRQLRLHALEALCDELAAQGRFAQAVEAALAAVELDPLRESAHRALIRVHMAEGNVSEAARELVGFSSFLHATMGVSPSPSLRRMAAELEIPWRCEQAGYHPRSG
jgi:SARP family transcriptional regulator, regulator of embCAB operon